MTQLPAIKAMYTDGACSGNPGPGGWGAVIYFEEGAVYEMGGAAAETTNNRMEMQAAIATLQFLQTHHYHQAVELHTDSEYLKKGITQWIRGWKKKGWTNSAGKPVLNQDLWKQLDELTQQLKQHDHVDITWKYVRGHTGNQGNERCDQIARAYSLNQAIQLRQDPRVLPTDSPELSRQTETKHNPENDEVLHQNELFLPPNSYDGKSADEGNNDMSDTGTHSVSEENRITRLRDALETLQTADEISQQGYLITSSELADLMDVNASAVTSRGDYWAWRNWTVSRIRREGNQILWQLERIDE
jgi:ribonuclease HI